MLLEERVMTDSGFYEELLIVEDELIDQYLSAELSEDERMNFEKHFLLSSARQEKLRFGRTFNEYVGGLEPLSDQVPAALRASKEPRDVFEPSSNKPFFPFLPFRNPILSYSLAAALVVIIGTVSWLGWKNWRGSDSHNPGKALAFKLTPGLSRGDGDNTNRISVPPDVETLQLRLQLTRNDYGSYRATLLRNVRSEVWTEDQLPPMNAEGIWFISADIPARLLIPGDYHVKVSGQPANGSPEDLASYRFRLVR